MTRRRSSRDLRSPVVVIGAGPTGLSAAYHLGEDALLLEQHDRVGGGCRSIEIDGFTFDHAGHVLGSNDPTVRALVEKLLGDNVHWQDGEAWIYSHGIHTRYPFQASLYGLPPEVVTECLMGAIEARLAAASRKRGLDAVKSGAPDGGAATSAPRARENMRQLVDRVFGHGIAKHFAIPYHEKLWAVPLEEVETSWLGGRLPLPSLEQMIAGAVAPAPKPRGPDARFGYVLRGGFQALMDAFVPHLRGRVELGARVTRLSALRRTLWLSDGRAIPFHRLISTIPLPALVRALGAEAPAAIAEAASRLRSVSVRCVNLGVGRPDVTDKHWIDYPGDTVFHRVFAQGNASPHCSPPGGFGLTCEITHSPTRPLPCDGDALVQRCIEDCRRVGLLREDDAIRVTHQVELPGACVVHDHGRAANVARIREWLEQRDIFSAGRYGAWECVDSDHAFLAGRAAARRVRESEGALTLGSTDAPRARRESSTL